MTDPSAPETHRDLLETPLFGHLATVRPDGAPQSSVMWFTWDGELLRFTHTTTRQKFQNFEHEPRVSFSIQDPAKPYRFVEVRGVVDSIVPDPEGAFFMEIGRRYGASFPPHDADVRVVIAVRPTRYVTVDNGMTPKELSDLVAQLASLPPDG